MMIGQEFRPTSYFQTQLDIFHHCEATVVTKVEMQLPPVPTSDVASNFVCCRMVGEAATSSTMISFQHDQSWQCSKRETNFKLKLSRSGDILHRQSKLNELKSRLRLPKPFSHCRANFRFGDIYKTMQHIVFKRRPDSLLSQRIAKPDAMDLEVLSNGLCTCPTGSFFQPRHGQRLWPCASLGTCAATHRTGLVISSQLSNGSKKQHRATKNRKKQQYESIQRIG